MEIKHAHGFMFGALQRDLLYNVTPSPTVIVTMHEGTQSIMAIKAV